MSNHPVNDLSQSAPLPRGRIAWFRAIYGPDGPDRQKPIEFGPDEPVLAGQFIQTAVLTL
jgi:hypothetical protein